MNHQVALAGKQLAGQNLADGGRIIKRDVRLWPRRGRGNTFGRTRPEAGAER